MAYGNYDDNRAYRGLLDEYPMPGMEMDPRELEKAKYLALMRMGLGMASKEPLGRAAGAGIATYSTMEENARRNADQKMQEARTKMQYAIAMKKAEEEQKAELRKAQFIKSIPDDELRAYGIPDPLIAGFKQAEKPEEYLKALDQFKSYTLSGGQTRFNAAGGVQNQLPNDAGVVTKFDPTGNPTGRQLLPGSAESAAAIAYATELAKRKAESETTLEEAPLSGDTTGATEKVPRAVLLDEWKVPKDVQKRRDDVRLSVLNKELADAIASGNKTNIAALQQEIAIAQGKTPTGATANIRPGRVKYPAPPPDHKWVSPGVEAEPIKGGPKDTSEKDLARIRGAISKADEVMAGIAEIKDSIGYKNTGIAAQLTGGIGWSPAMDLEKRLDYIRSNVGFQELAKMRQESPTGGALGQVALQELAMLQSTLGSLDARQSPELLKKSVENVEKHYANLKRELERQGIKLGRGSTGDWDEKSDPLGLRK